MVVLSTVKFIFNKYPLASNCFTYGCMCVGAEFSQQFVNKRLLTPVEWYLLAGETMSARGCQRISRFSTLKRHPLCGHGYASSYKHDPKELSEAFDIESLKRYAVYGFAIGPNVLYFWYKWVDKKYVGTATRIVAKKVLMDQFLISPILYILFYTSMSVMERKPDILAECKAKLLPTFKTSCLFWLPATTINFKLIPSSLRVVYVGSCSFVWINILCWLKRKEI